ncbi:MAG: hypothetical protein AB7U76_24075 [Pirellulales bacterium]
MDADPRLTLASEIDAALAAQVAAAFRERLLDFSTLRLATEVRQ